MSERRLTSTPAGARGPVAAGWRCSCSPRSRSPTAPGCCWRCGAPGSVGDVVRLPGACRESSAGSRRARAGALRREAHRQFSRDRARRSSGVVSSCGRVLMSLADLAAACARAGSTTLHATSCTRRDFAPGDYPPPSGPAAARRPAPAGGEVVELNMVHLHGPGCCLHRAGRRRPVLGWLATGRVVGARDRAQAHVAHAERLRALPRSGALVRRRTSLAAAAPSAPCVVVAGGVVVAAADVDRDDPAVNPSRDIMLCLDVSGSMTEVDVEVLERVRGAARRASRASGSA